MQPTLTESAATVFTVLAGAGVATRPQLAVRAGLSKPTVSTAVAELEAAGLAARTGTSHGNTGRSAALYGLGPAAGCVLAVDLGSTHTEVRGCALDGTVLVSRTTAAARTAARARSGAYDAPIPGARARSGAYDANSGATGPRAAVHAALVALAGVRVRAAVIAVPDVAPVHGGSGPRAGTSRVADAATPRVADAVASLALPPEIPVRIENNVNCAALTELHEGAARGRDSFGYLQVGYGIGLGIVVGGQVLRGANGAAGEIARLPYPWAEGRESVHEGLETYAGAGSLVRRVAAGWDPGDGPCPRTAEELFALAAQGRPGAGAFVTAHAREVGRLAAAVAAVLDPGLIVLGGGIGANPQLLPGVRAELARLSWPTEVVSSMAGESGTVAGAARLAVACGVQTVTGGDRAGH
ncbi:ROK family protein [Streptomyces sp. NPDC087658]|uniref:ROK family protein n=1 Tax=Streptomyces sp. NPDC087658 TaxID=3365800 RepID=UPI0038130B47